MEWYVSTPTAPLDSALIDAIDAVTRSTGLSDLTHLLSTTCVSALGAQAAGVMITNQSGGLRVVAASDDDTRSLELFEIQRHEGPCYESATTGQQVLLEDMESATSWPAFSAEALALGHRSAIAVPLQIDGSLIGALNVFWAEPQKFTDQVIRYARAFADLTAMGIANQDRAIDLHELVIRLEEAAQDRIMIEQAKGMLSVQGDLSMHDAFALMKDYGLRTGKPLLTIADEVIARRVRASDMTN